jgi:hypothetical protein
LILIIPSNHVVLGTDSNVQFECGQQKYFNLKITNEQEIKSKSKRKRERQLNTLRRQKQESWFRRWRRENKRRKFCDI